MQVRLIRLAAVAVLGSIAVAGCGKYSISNIRSLKAFQDANRMYQRGDYAEAIERYEAAVSFNPDLGFAYFFLGNSYDNMWRPARVGEPENDALLPKAVENYRIAIDKLADSENPQEQEIRKLSYEYLIAAYGADKLNDFQQAEPIAREMIAMEPDNPANYQALARLYEAREMFAEAEAEYRKAIDLDPSNPVNYLVLAGYFDRQGDFEKAMEAFLQRAEAEPNNPEAWYALASNYSGKVTQDKTLSRGTQVEYLRLGVEASDRALALNPDYIEALVFKNILLRQQALFENNIPRRNELLEEADRLRDRAMELQNQQAMSSDEGSAAAGAGSGGGGGQ